MEKQVVYESQFKLIALLVISWGFTLTSLWTMYWSGAAFFGLCAVVATYRLLDPRKKLLFHGTPAYRAHLASELEAWQADPGGITYVDGGFRVPASTGDPMTDYVVAWDELQALFAYKRDLYATDEICLDVFFPEASSFTITEATAGWHIFMEQLETHLPLPAGWFAEVAVPAFETKLTLLYERDHHSFTEAVDMYYPANTQPSC